MTLNIKTTVCAKACTHLSDMQGTEKVRLRLGDYSTIFTEPEANNCFSIISELNNRE